jgi:nucleoside 2-deoxyribosyltransferase
MDGEALTIFLGGPIQHAMEEPNKFCHQTEAAISSAIGHLRAAGFTVLSAHAFEEFGRLDMDGKSREVTKRDFQWMHECDVFVALFPPSNRENGLFRSDGMCVELGWASALAKSVILVRPSEAKCSHLMNGLDALTQVMVLDYEHTMEHPENLVAAVLALSQPGCRT